MDSTDPRRLFEGKFLRAIGLGQIKRLQIKPGYSMGAAILKVRPTFVGACLFLVDIKYDYNCVN
jgi:hypothetical protein